MKRVLTVITAACLLAACTGTDARNGGAETMDSSTRAQAMNDTSRYTTLQWVDSMHQDLGTIKEGQVPEVSWKFRNTGNTPLVVLSATASCGCTVAETPREPIQPGGEGTIKAKFDSHGRQGEQRKEVYVQATTKGGGAHQLTFRVNVDKQ
ncbi:MAG TPA: DUF1573 domain-containing protein [Chitinophagaceae bacterium]|jgi:hypothetical protein|nr:DUF1573 domain-containing protein [Chitinophagaceae bacterium]